MLRKIRRAALLGAAAFAVAGTAYSQNEQFVPMNGYWVGPYAAGGSGIFRGLVDQKQRINPRGGGMNGGQINLGQGGTQDHNARGVRGVEGNQHGGATG